MNMTENEPQTPVEPPLDPVETLRRRKGRDQKPFAVMVADLEAARVRFDLSPEDEVVLCITGNGLKTVEALGGALPEAPIIAPRIRDLEALYGRDL